MRNNIKRYRLEKGLLQRELGDAIGVHKAVISQWEQGTRAPSPAQQLDIAVVLEHSVKDIFPDHEPETPVMVVKHSDRRNISTMGALRKRANIRMGEKMAVRLTNVADYGTTFVPATVVQIRPDWFRVRTDNSGFSVCVHYQEFLSENDVRRVKA